MGTYEITTESGAVYQVETEDSPIFSAPDSQINHVDNILTGVRNSPQTAVDMASSIPSGASNVFNSVFSPVESLEDGTTERTLRGVGSLAAGGSGTMLGGGAGATIGSVFGPIGAAAGGLIGGAVGGGAGLFGWDYMNEVLGNDVPTTIEEKIKRFEENIGTGLALGAVSKAATVPGKMIRGTAETAPKAASALDRKSVGFTKSDYGKASSLQTIEDVGTGEIQSKIRSQVDPILEEGLLGKSRDPSDVLKAVEKQAVPLAEELNSKIAAYDAGGNPPVAPDFSNALQAIYSGKIHPDVAAQYATRLYAIDEGIRDPNLGAGKLSYIQELKESLPFKTEDSMVNSFNRAIYMDLKNSIEARVPEAKGINQQLAPYQTLDTVANRSLIASDNRSFGDTIKSVAGWGGGIGLPAALGSTLGPVGTAVGVGVGLTGKWLASPNGQAALARGLRSTGRAAKAVDRVTGPPTSAISSMFAPLVGAAEATNDQRGRAVSTQSPDSSATAGLTREDVARMGQFGTPEQQRDLELSVIDKMRNGGMSEAAAKEATYQEWKGRGVVNSASSEMIAKAQPVEQKNPTPPREQSASGIMKAPPTAISELFTPSRFKDEENMDSKPVEVVEHEIDKDPYYSTLYEIESGRNPKAKNPNSSAKGGFQFIDSTAKSLSLEDPFDLEQSFEAVQKLTDENRKRFKTNDPVILYAAHYLGAHVLGKVLEGQALNKKEQSQVDYLISKVLPKVKAVYEKKITPVIA